MNSSSLLKLKYGLQRQFSCSVDPDKLLGSFHALNHKKIRWKPSKMPLRSREIFLVSIRQSSMTTMSRLFSTRILPAHLCSLREFGRNFPNRE